MNVKAIQAGAIRARIKWLIPQNVVFRSDPETAVADMLQKPASEPFVATVLSPTASQGSPKRYTTSRYDSILRIGVADWSRSGDVLLDILVHPRTEPQPGERSVTTRSRALICVQRHRNWIKRDSRESARCQ